MDSERYNPLDKRNLGASVANALLARPVVTLPAPGRVMAGAEPFIGAGIYAIYYTGELRIYPAYEQLAFANREGRYEQPIYVGKAIPEGARKAGIGLDIEPGPDLFRRLRDHAKSIDQAENLDLADFMCRHLVVDDIWIPLGESLLIRETRPLWNLVVDGFENHDPGDRRVAQQRSAWDVLHPGRPWALKLSANPKSVEVIETEIQRFLSGDMRLAKTVEEAMSDEEDSRP